MNNKNDNRLKEQNKVLAHQFYLMMESQIPSDNLRLFETKTGIGLLHIPSSVHVVKDIKSQVVQGLIEVTPESALEQLKMLADELKMKVQNNKTSESKYDVHEQVKKWFRYIAKNKYESEIIFDSIEPAKVDKEVQKFKGLYLTSFLSEIAESEESELFRILDNLPLDFTKKAEDTVLNLITVFKREYYQENLFDLTDELSDYFKSKLTTILEQYGVQKALRATVAIHPDVYSIKATYDVEQGIIDGINFPTLEKGLAWYTYPEFSTGKLKKELLDEYIEMFEQNIKNEALTSI